MKNYLALIRKADFIDLYRYGIIYISETSSVEFICAPEDLSSHIEVFDELVKYANEFDNAFVYIFVHYKLPEDARRNTINIDDVQHIYPLDNEAMREFATSFDERIHISEPIWNNAIFELQKKWAVQNSLKGAQNLWKILNIAYPIEEVQRIITTEIVEQVIEDLYSNRRPEGALPLTAYLMRYERHAFYPKDTIGFFMDAVHAYCNFISKTEIESIESTQAYAVFAKRKMNSLKYKDIISKCKKEKDLESFKAALQKNCPEYSYFDVAPLFFALRNNFHEGLDGDYLRYYKECTKLASEENLSIAIYMLGVILGHSKTYDALYESLPLAIFQPKFKFKQKTTQQITSEKVSKKIEEKECTLAGSNVPLTINRTHIEELVDDSSEVKTIYSKMNQDDGIDSNQQDSETSHIIKNLFEEEITYPCFMVKPTKTGKIPKRTKDIKKANTKEEYILYLSKGYQSYNS